jgi:DNA-directed RNA polymerase specialized sigma24 family protein
MSLRNPDDVVAHLQRLAARASGDLPDRQLLERFVSQHDEMAFAALVERHGAMVVSVCRRILQHQQDAEDACQATFLVLARRAASIRKRASVGS